MYFPEDMTFSYFFFDTDPGLFLQMVPVALIAGALWLAVQHRRQPELSAGRLMLSALFVCYLAALLALTLFSGPIGRLYHALFYGTPLCRESTGTGLTYDFIPTVFTEITGENLGNLLLFLPFGVLDPLHTPETTAGRTLLRGVGTSLLIENVQPFLGRAFDVNDLIMNTAGLLIGMGVFAGMRKLCRRRSTKN